MVIVYSVNQRFPLAVRIEIRRDLLQHSPVERLCNDLAVKSVDLEFHVIFELGAVQHLAGRRIINCQLFALLIVDAFDTQLGLDAMRGIMIDEITVDHSFTVRVIEDRFPENLRRVQRGRSGQSYLDGVKVFDDCPVFTDIIILIAVEHFRFAHFLVKDVSAVSLVHNNQIIVGNRGHRFALGI